MMPCFSFNISGETITQGWSKKNCKRDSALNGSEFDKAKINYNEVIAEQNNFWGNLHLYLK